MRQILLLVTVFFIGCAHEVRHSRPSRSETKAQVSATDLPAVQTAAAQTVESTIPHPALPQISQGIEPLKALGWLKNGNKRFVKSNFRTDGKSKIDRLRLYEGQKPHTIVLSCSDSRVPPEIIFDQSLGEIFVVRVAGEALDSSVVASIEYAVEHLGSRLILVMGHSKCGAIAAAEGTPVGSTAGSVSLDKMVSDIRPRLPVSTKLSTDMLNESFENAKGVAKDLLVRSPLIQEMVAAGRLVVTSSIYDMKTGVVEFDKLETHQ